MGEQPRNMIDRGGLPGHENTMQQAQFLTHDAALFVDASTSATTPHNHFLASTAPFAQPSPLQCASLPAQLVSHTPFVLVPPVPFYQPQGSLKLNLPPAPSPTWNGVDASLGAVPRPIHSFSSPTAPVPYPPAEFRAGDPTNRQPHSEQPAQPTHPTPAPALTPALFCCPVLGQTKPLRPKDSFECMFGPILHAPLVSAALSAEPDSEAIFGDAHPLPSHPSIPRVQLRNPTFVPKPQPLPLSPSLSAVPVPSLLASSQLLYSHNPTPQVAKPVKCILRLKRSPTRTPPHFTRFLRALIQSSIAVRLGATMDELVADVMPYYLWDMNHIRGKLALLLRSMRCLMDRITMRWYMPVMAEEHADKERARTVVEAREAVLMQASPNFTPVSIDAAEGAYGPIYRPEGWQPSHELCTLLKSIISARGGASLDFLVRGVMPFIAGLVPGWRRLPSGASTPRILTWTVAEVRQAVLEHLFYMEGRMLGEVCLLSPADWIPQEEGDMVREKACHRLTEIAMLGSSDDLPAWTYWSLPPGTGVSARLSVRPKPYLAAVEELEMLEQELALEWEKVESDSSESTDEEILSISSTDARLADADAVAAAFDLSNNSDADMTQPDTPVTKGNGEVAEVVSLAMPLSLSVQTEVRQSPNFVPLQPAFPLHAEVEAQATSRGSSSLMLPLETTAEAAAHDTDEVLLLSL